MALTSLLLFQSPLYFSSQAFTQCIERALSEPQTYVFQNRSFVYAPAYPPAMPPGYPAQFPPGSYPPFPFPSHSMMPPTHPMLATHPLSSVPPSPYSFPHDASATASAIGLPPG